MTFSKRTAPNPPTPRSDEATLSQNAIICLNYLEGDAAAARKRANSSYNHIDMLMDRVDKLKFDIEGLKNDKNGLEGELQRSRAREYAPAPELRDLKSKGKESIKNLWGSMKGLKIVPAAG